ncbi:hypothetical protein BDE36_0264 [Arcticibacter tournemirensis]|uniref:Lipoprotein n=1 Tax=Arcticibacter tournemirensis TaxID=699437 RepID=A0A5M9GUQ0_9SPHI|nr:hypothetical protein [Arcticibacter tournemirensis]KAA8478432.1 hypothetical protein F1649_17740 [Arcticibacter tournemirensis]TQM48577.1 hypothetical protein BDE36_0264 [Arcticibacter tournemirensis]
MNKTFLIVGLLALSSCSSKNSRENAVNDSVNESVAAPANKTLTKIDTINPNDLKANNQEEEVNAIDLKPFTELPQELDGCGCYFYLSKKDEKEDKYIFVNDFASTAFVFVNNRLEKFELKEHDEGSNFYSYSNERYDLKIEITKKSTGGDETSNIEGVLTIKKGKEELKKTFVGTCGC